MAKLHRSFPTFVLFVSLVVTCTCARADDADIVLPRVPATAPEKALGTIEVADGFRMELLAAEPQVVDPVAMAFDERGRLYVVEMRDYSEQDKDRLGRVRLLTDEDGDGRLEKSQVFVEDLSWPTAITCYDGGVFIGNPPEILYCKDTSGDGKADERRVVFTGFARSNVQGMMNSLQWGYDQRIHGSASTTGGQITRPGTNDPPLELRGRDFAFDPKTLQIEATTGGGQHGMTFNRWGDRFVCHNSDHLQAIIFEERYLARNPYQSIVSARRSIAADGPQAEVFRASPVEAWREARTKLRIEGRAPGPVEMGGRSAGYFTSGTGVTVYEGGLWAEAAGNGLVYIADVGSNLIHRKRLKPDGVTYLGERIDNRTEFVRSTDIWFRPVQMAIGPEGALYVADMYREVIEHPLSLPPELKKQLDLTSGNDRGRIYRIVPADWQNTPRPMLADLDTPALVREIDQENMWRRLTAARLLYERADPSSVPLLRDQFAKSPRPATRIAALYALRAADGLQVADIAAALQDDHPQVRRHALRLAEPFLDSSPELLERVVALTSDEDPVVQFQLAFTLGETGSPRATQALAEIIVRNAASDDIASAALTSIAERAGPLLEALLADHVWLASPHSRRVIDAVVAQIVRQRREADLDVLLRTLNAPAGRGASVSTVYVLRALGRLPANVLASGDLPQIAELRRLQTEAARNIVLDALRVLNQPEASLEQRVAAVENLGFDTFNNQREMLERLLVPQEPAVIRAAVLTACAEYSAPEVAQLVVSRWQEFSPAERSQATELLLRREPWARALLGYLEAEGVPLTTLDPSHIARLENYPSQAVRQTARKLRGQSISQDRQKVFEDYRDVALAGGDASRGKAMFEKNCAACHQLGGKGEPIGPNLASMVSRGAESVLFNILAPSREVEPRYLEYVLTTAEGQVLTGIIAGETSTAVTLRSAENKTDTVLRVDIEDLHTTGKSLMPDGFEKLIDKQAMADLLTYLQEAAEVGAASRAARGE